MRICIPFVIGTAIGTAIGTLIGYAYFHSCQTHKISYVPLVTDTLPVFDRGQRVYSYEISDTSLNYEDISRCYHKDVLFYFTIEHKLNTMLRHLFSKYDNLTQFTHIALCVEHFVALIRVVSTTSSSTKVVMMKWSE